VYKPTLVRTKSDALDDDDPNTTAPDADEVFAMSRGNNGYRASLEFGAGQTCDVTIWVRNETTSRWAAIATLAGVGPDELFGDLGPDSDVPDAAVWVQLTNVTGGNPVAVYLQDL
jgi:hypothetical protein